MAPTRQTWRRESCAQVKKLSFCAVGNSQAILTTPPPGCWQPRVVDTPHTRTRQYDSPELTARRLVEMAANIIMSYLLIIDANRDMQFAKSAKVYNKIARQVVHGHGEFIRVSQVSDPDSYKFELE